MQYCWPISRLLVSKCALCSGLSLFLLSWTLGRTIIAESKISMTFYLMKKDIICTCPKGSFVSKIASQHKNDREDRWFSIECRRVLDALKKNHINKPKQISNWWVHSYWRQSMIIKLLLNNRLSFIERKPSESPKNGNKT